LLLVFDEGPESALRTLGQAVLMPPKSTDVIMIGDEMQGTFEQIYQRGKDNGQPSDILSVQHSPGKEFHYLRAY